MAAHATLSACTNVRVGDTSKVVKIIGDRLYGQNSLGGFDVCAINPDGTLGACVRTPPSETFFDAAFTRTNVYLTTLGTDLRRCPLNADGTFGTCVTLNDADFVMTTGIALR